MWNIRVTQMIRTIRHRKIRPRVVIPTILPTSTRLVTWKNGALKPSATATIHVIHVGNAMRKPLPSSATKDADGGGVADGLGLKTISFLEATHRLVYSPTLAELCRVAKA